MEMTGTKRQGVAGESSILTSSRRRLEAVFSADGEADVVCSRARENYFGRRGCFPSSAVCRETGPIPRVTVSNIAPFLRSRIFLL